jgi:hypothetical protein
MRSPTAPHVLVRNFARLRDSCSLACDHEPFPNNLRKYTIMKKYIILAAAALVASIGVGYAANSLRETESHSKCGIGHKCSTCNGTGWQGQFKCSMCKGTGANSSY